MGQLALQTNTADEEDREVVQHILRLKLKSPLYTHWIDALSVLLRNNKYNLLSLFVMNVTKHTHIHRSYSPLALRYFVEHELLPAKPTSSPNIKLLAVIVEAMDKLGYRPESEIALIFQELSVHEEGSLLKDRLCKVCFSFPAQDTYCATHLSTYKLVRGLAGLRLDVFLLASELLQEPEQSGIEFPPDYRPRELYVTNVMELASCLPVLGMPEDPADLRYDHVKLSVNLILSRLSMLTLTQP